MRSLAGQPSHSMNVEQRGWFATLEHSLSRISDGNALETYLIKTGPVAFNITLDGSTRFRNIVKAFFSAKRVDRPDKDIFTIFCLGRDFARQLPNLEINPVELREILERNKKFGETQLIIPDLIRGIVKTFDGLGRKGLLYIDDPDILPSWEFFTPLKEFVHLLALESNCWLSHAGSISKGGTGILLAGPGGSGKSTTTLCALHNDATTSGDDYVLIEPSKTISKVYTVYRTIKSHESSPVDLPLSFDKFDFKIDPITRKKVIFCNTSENIGPFGKGFSLRYIAGLSLIRPTVKSGTDSLTSRSASNFTHFAMSSFSQMPFWMDKSMVIASQIFRSVDYHSTHIPVGLDPIQLITQNLLNSIKA